MAASSTSAASGISDWEEVVDTHTAGGQRFSGLRVAVSRAQRCGLIELSRPGKMNALSATCWLELPRAAALLSSRDDIRVVLLTGAGRHFCSGIDVGMLVDVAQLTSGGGCPGESRMALKQQVQQMQESFTAFERCRWPVVAAIQGACIGAGINLAAACDIRLCSHDAVFSVKEIDLGITADIGILQRLGPLVGHGVAAEWSLTARKVTGKEAMQRGFVAECYESQEGLMKGVVDMVQELASKPKLAIIGTKRILLHARDHTVTEGLDYVATWNSAFLPSDDLDRALKQTLARVSKQNSSKL